MSAVAPIVLIHRFSKEEQFAAEREGFIKQINSFSQTAFHREYGRYDHRDGVFGEIAFTAWAGIERAPTEVGVLSDGGVDFLDGDLSIDVKATAARGTWPVGKAHLLRPKTYPAKADVYVLIVLDEPRNRARFAGWATRDEIEAAEIRKPGDDERPRVYAPARCISERDLHREWKGWL